VADHTGMPEPRIKRYALVPHPGEDGVRRFSLARVASSGPDVERMERMEEIAARELRAGPEPTRRPRTDV
jgi:hypothetical protein